MLLDTSGLLCLLHRAEPLHARAVEIYRSAQVRITHGYVLAAFVALCHVRGLPRPTVLEFVQNLTSNPDITTVWCDESLHGHAMALLADRLDKTYSLCDAASFFIMRDCRITAALTTDRHFEQEGFERLLK